jgi:hypothetical protein
MTARKLSLALYKAFNTLWGGRGALCTVENANNLNQDLRAGRVAYSLDYGDFYFFDKKENNKQDMDAKLSVKVLL